MHGLGRVLVVGALALALQGLASGTAQARSYGYRPAPPPAPSFDFLSAGFASGKWGDDWANGAIVGASFMLTDAWFGYLNADRESLDDASMTTLNAGLGYAHSYRQNTVIYGGFGFIQGRIDWGDQADAIGAVTESGYELNVGVRHRVNQQLELDARFGHVDLGAGDQNLRLLGRYYVNQRWAVELGYTFVNSDSALAQVGFSYHF
ncbi:hypothetical protein NOG12_08695 [Pseudidiomarina sp. GXY010]|uniref:Outer membrane protein beta-barrel domain-containing protein n=1 Tax=Pseudidiomarina fusca TaxID=2965078 RepID=A0ABU3KZ02_9GAMM|nr:outer membrane beta-barrel protein [Pseudidiomarina sp. GXY010]MDT7526153.1 hypothetical protein [Pseudidiomarina sp. GXY010]